MRGTMATFNIHDVPDSFVDDFLGDTFSFILSLSLLVCNKCQTAILKGKEVSHLGDAPHPMSRPLLAEYTPNWNSASRLA